ncbi:MAG: glycosyltransferase family 4 protein [Acidobacteriota bacterium]|nr:glycosyltransferase family 4 protein [Acidobacteriota bacterium]
MKITFVLPMYLNSPSGGFKVVYEYANRLAALGHQVAVVHPRTIAPQSGLVEAVKKRLWKFKLRNIPNRKPLHRRGAENTEDAQRLWQKTLRNLCDALRLGGENASLRLVPWFKVNDNVNLILATDLNEQNIPDADAIFATASDTAFPVAACSVNKGRKFYLVQSYEAWNLPEETVIASWQLPMHKIVVSRQLQQIAASLGEAQRTTYIPLGLDVSVFRLLTPIHERHELRVGMLAHPNEVKGSRDGLAALELVKAKLPDLQVALFGTEPRLDFIPEWMSYERLPSAERLVELYNSCRIFLNPARAEGWGLPAAEAMACGCAVVSADNGGIHEFAVDGETALIVPIQRPDLLAEKILALIDDDELRWRLAVAGHQSIQQFSWEQAVNSMIEVLS